MTEPSKIATGLPAGTESQMAAAVDAYLAAVRAGDAPDPDAFAAGYPAVADDLRRVLSALALVGASDIGSAGGAVGAPHGAPGEGAALGDYRLVREVGRGGMG